LLTRSDPIEHAHRLDASQDLGLHEECRSCEGMSVEEVYGLPLACRSHWNEPQAGLTSDGLARVEAADQRSHMVHLPHPLTEHPFVDLLEIVVGLTRRGRRIHQ